MYVVCTETDAISIGNYISDFKILDFDDTRSLHISFSLVQHTKFHQNQTVFALKYDDIISLKP